MSPHLECAEERNAQEEDLYKKLVIVTDLGVSPPTDDPDFLSECHPFEGGVWEVRWCEQHKRNYVTAEDETPMGTPLRMVWGCGTHLAFVEL